MNLPNKLTILRVALIPVFLVFMLVEAIPFNILIALVVFGAASLTDMIDGKLARKYNLVTKFGKFLDPLADKMLVMAALVCFSARGWVDVVAVIIILAREFMVSALRLVTAGEGVVVAAGIWGKLKTAFTMVALVAIMAIEGFGFHSLLVNEILIWIAAALTVISGVQYLAAYWSYIDSGK